MKKQVLYFDEPYKVVVREESQKPPGPGQVLVQTIFSAISQGTELLIYRAQVPLGFEVDEIIPALKGRFEFPMKYGYSVVGKVIGCGQGVNPNWQGKTVFTFHPHESHFCANLNEILLVPNNISPEEALFIPNMEAAINFVMDGKPLIGEQVAVFGQGIVGLLTTALLAKMPLASLVTLDRFPRRRRTSLDLGAHVSLDPFSPDLIDQLLSILKGPRTYRGADLVYEISGNPNALDMAIAGTGFGGRVVIGSWYGQKESTLNLSGRFHRSRIKLISSQVSSIAPEFTGRWKKIRRLQLAIHLISQLKPAWLITHKFPIDKAVQAYTLIDKNPAESIQVIFDY
jgi:2-desacetyl-2-hydroxyethyl bacteriochlorophyllide A dehydrogenase